jgi:hypothetical protein
MRKLDRYITSVTIVLEKMDLSKIQRLQVSLTVILTAHSGKMASFGNSHCQSFESNRRSMMRFASIQSAMYCGLTLSSHPSRKHLYDGERNVKTITRKTWQTKGHYLPVSRRGSRKIKDENGGHREQNRIGQTNKKSKLKRAGIA